MSSIPSPGSGSRKTTVSIGEGSRRKAEKTVLGEIRSIEPPDPTNRRRKRKRSKPAKWSRAFKKEIVVSIVLLLLLLAIGGGFLLSRIKVMKEEARQAAAPSRKQIIPVPKEEVGEFTEADAELLSSDTKGVATSFAYAETVEERSGYVLDASNINAYPEQARTAIPMRIASLGIGNDGENQYAQYAAMFADEGTRLIAVVATQYGPKVDWDCYARHGTAQWPSIFAGGVEKAEVRVFVRPSDYYNFAFPDDKKWLAYEVSSPDAENSVFAYARKDSELATHLESVFVSSDGEPVRLILELSKSPEGLPHRQFILSRLVAEGWVKRK